MSITCPALTRATVKIRADSLRSLRGGQTPFNHSQMCPMCCVWRFGVCVSWWQVAWDPSWASGRVASWTGRRVPRPRAAFRYWSGRVPGSCPQSEGHCKVTSPLLWLSTCKKLIRKVSSFRKHSVGTLTLAHGTAGVDGHKTTFCQTSTHDSLHTKFSVSIPVLQPFNTTTPNIRAHCLLLFLLT